MANMRKSESLHRALTWNGRSLSVLSKKELQECIIHLARQLSLANDKLEEARQLSLANDKLEEAHVAVSETPVQD